LRDSKRAPRRLKFRLAEGIFLRLNGRKIVGEKWFSWRKPRDVLDTIAACTASRQKLHVFAHNAAFDLTQIGFWPAVESGEFSLGTACLEDSPFFLDATTQGRKLRVLDSLNFFRASIEQLGDKVGCPKLTMPLDGNFNSIPTEELALYCRRDVEILKMYLLAFFDFVRDNDLGNFAPTLPALAMNNFRHKHMHEKILVHGSKQALEMEKECLFGGWCQSFYSKKITTPVFNLDFTSLYPSVMRGESMPTKLIGYYEHVSVDWLRTVSKSYWVVARVRVSTSTHAMPYRFLGRLTRAVGAYWGTFCGAELDGALKAGIVKEVNYACVYSCAPIFKSYVDYWFSERRRHKQDKNDIMAHFCKMMLNSLSGKWAQRGRRWETVQGEVAPKKWEVFYTVDETTGKPISHRAIGWQVQKLIEEPWASQSVPSITAAITSAAREVMRAAIDAAGLDEVYYCDTDSLHVSQRGYDRLDRAGWIVAGKLGRMRLVEKYDWAQYYGAKRYRTSRGIVWSGLKASAEQISEREWRQDKWQRLASIFESGNLDEVTIRDETVYLDQSLPAHENESGRILPLCLSYAGVIDATPEQLTYLD